jgi:hypothetical protein
LVQPSFRKRKWNYLSHWVKQSNETFVVDLAKMPLTNGRCYRKICGSECRSYFVATKHPAEVKFVLDPKKVELTLLIKLKDTI